MNRRSFFRSLGGAVFALTLRLRPESALPVVDDPLVHGFKGASFFGTHGYINTPYIPLYYTRAK